MIQLKSAEIQQQPERRAGKRVDRRQQESAITQPVWIALDVMGGELGLTEMIGGAVAAARDDGAHVQLVGRSNEIAPELAKQGGPTDHIVIVDAPDVIAMDDAPVTAAKGKPGSSIVVGLSLVRSGEAQGFVSPGNSGAVMAAALFRLGRIRGVERPALATVFPTLTGYCLLVDVGANVDCRPEQLVQFGIMGATYSERVLKIQNPRVGLLSNGEEASKGNTLIRETHPLLMASGVNFVGNVEGKDLHQHAADVIVMDGFTGNVVLKLAEGLGSFMKQMIREEARRDLIGTLGGLLLKPAFKRLGRRVDYDEYGGAPLLGVEGVCIISHGRSNAKAIRSALRVAKQAAETGLTDAIRQGIQANLARPAASPVSGIPQPG